MPWLRRSLDSIAQQEYPHLSVCVIDDCSTQAGQRQLIDYYCRKQGWTPLLNHERLGCLANTVRGIQALNCSPSDVVGVVDGDDWLTDSGAIGRLVDVYAEGDVELTYGQYLRYPLYEWGHSRPIHREVVRGRRYRERPWQTSQLRTFLYALWSQIDDRDLRDEDGEYYSHAAELAYMYPMLEMCGERFRFLSDPFYVYNRDTPFNEDKCRKREQDAAAERIRSRTRYGAILR